MPPQYRTAPACPGPLFSNQFLIIAEWVLEKLLRPSSFCLRLFLGAHHQRARRAEHSKVAPLLGDLSVYHHQRQLNPGGPGHQQAAACHLAQGDVPSACPVLAHLRHRQAALDSVPDCRAQVVLCVCRRLAGRFQERLLVHLWWVAKLSAIRLAHLYDVFRVPDPWVLRPEKSHRPAKLPHLESQRARRSRSVELVRAVCLSFLFRTPQEKLPAPPKPLD
jgi:hypothetical protein